MSMSMPNKPIILSIFSVLLLAISAFPSPSFSALFAPIQKDLNTNQYFVTVYLQTPLRPTNLFLHLAGSFSWVDCTRKYNSTTYRNIPCGTPLCDALHSNICYDEHDGPPGPGDLNNSCCLTPENPVKHHPIYLGDALVDTLALPTTSPSHHVPLALLPNFTLACSSQSLLTGLSKKVTGLAGFARSNYSLPAQVSSTFSSPYVFALCLPSSDKAPGAVVFNTSGPCLFSSGIDLSKYLVYTPLPVDVSQIAYYGYPSDEYIIGVTSVKINGKALKLNRTLLTIDENGIGGTKISTAVPYTVLHTSIFTALTDAFVKESAARNLRVTTPVKPFGVCYAAKDVSSTNVGPTVPTIDLVMQSENVYWRILGANSMVRVQNKGVDVWCLGFVNGGAKPRTSIVIGGQQLEDNLLQFDVQSKRLGFSSSVLAHGTTCSNFNSNGK